jgi:transposase InsO family protein
METEGNVEQKIEGKGKEGKRRPLKGAGRRSKNSFDLRLKAVKLHLEEGFSAAMIQKELGVSPFCLYRWTSLYRKQGEEALRPAKRQGKRTPTPVREKIVALKKENPQLGVKRISDTLKRFFFLKASPETVRKTLKEEDLIETPKKKRVRNPPKPRFFERSTPNQLWQSDIFTFRLGGKNAYLIGFIDDYSRFLTGLDLFRSQTAENVLSVYRIAAGEYGPPKEMLTDNGRQYVNWRGTTKFEAEMKKDRIHHLRSRPHHPMTLGKIERFWKTIFVEFLSRAQFTSFEEARDRVRHWVAYYNFKRPHQSIGGLCPADRFFEIQSELKRTLEHGIQENVLELALRGKPKSPFYMVGRMGDQSVVIRAEKGKVKMLLDGKEPDKERELEYTMEASDEDEGAGPEGGAGKENGIADASGAGSGEGGAFGVVGAAQALAGVPEPGDQVDGLKELGGAGALGDAAGAAAAEGSGAGAGAEPAAPGLDRAEGGSGGGAGEPSGEAAFAAPEIEVLAGRGAFPQRPGGQGGVIDEGGGIKGSGAKTRGGDPCGAVGEDDGEGGGPGARGLAQDVLRVGGAGALGNDGGADGPAGGPAEEKEQAEGEKRGGEGAHRGDPPAFRADLPGGATEQLPEDAGGVSGPGALDGEGGGP